MGETSVVEAKPRPSHHHALFGVLFVFALAVAGASLNDPVTLLAALGVALLCVYLECYFADGPPLFRIGVAVVATILLGLFARKSIFDPPALAVTPSATAELAKTQNEQDVRNMIAGRGRAFWSLVPEWPVPKMSPPPAPAPNDTDTKSALESKLTLWEFYPKYEWPLSGVTSTESASIDGKTLRAIYDANRDDYRLTPLLANGNASDGVPLENPRIVIWLPSSVEIKPTRFWAPNVDANTKSFFTGPNFGPVLTAPSTVNESLFLKFPWPGSYPVKYRLEGVARGIAVRKDGTFTLELVDPKTQP